MDRGRELGSSAALMSTTPSDDDVCAAAREILEHTDLATTTERQIRKQVEEQLQTDLSNRKQIVRDEVERFLESQEPEEKEHAAADASAQQADAGGGFGSVGLSQELQDFLGDGTTSLPRSQLVKRIWDYVKANDRQDPSNKQRFILDEKMSTIFTAPVNMFSMNKQLSKHCWTLELSEEQKAAQKAARKAKAAAVTPEEKAAKKEKAAARKRKSAGLDENGEPKKRSSNFSKELRASTDLAAWTGKDTISRPEVTKFFWEYVKENQLQDPESKKEIISDEVLKKLTGQERFTAFGHMKFFSPHLTAI